MSTQTITEFLEARIAEDELEARECIASPEHRPKRWVRILAECAAKRAIIEMHGPVKDEGWISGAAHDNLWCGMCGSIDDSPEPHPCPTLKALAAVYKDRADYQEDWAL